METPNRVKVNILALLLTHGAKRGIALDRLASLYEEDIQEPLDFKAWGFSFLMEFFQAMPELFRLKYERREESWKVYPRVKRNPLLTRNIPHSTETERTTSLPGKLRQQTKDTFAVLETESVDSVEEDTRPVDVNQLLIVPDHRGLYSVCFSTERKPEEWKDLKGIFSMAGPVVEIHQTAKMTFVRYASADMLRLAMKLFPLLGLSVARVNIDVRRADQVERRSPVVTDESSVEVLVRNLHTHFTVTKVHLQDLFHGFDLLHVDVHYDSSLRSQFAEVRLATMSEARRLISLFHGHNFLGRSLVISIKSPERASLSQKENLPLQTRTLNFGSSQKCSNPKNREKDIPRRKLHSDREMFASNLKKEDDIGMESMCLEHFSDCEIEEEVEEIAYEHRSVFRQAYGRSALPGGRDEASFKRREDASWGIGELRYGFDKQTPDFRESSGMGHFYMEQETTTEMSHSNSRGCQPENIHKEWTPNKTLLGSDGFSSRHLQQGHNRETPHGKGQSSFQENFHQRQDSPMTKRSQDKQESLFSKNTQHGRMFDTDLELEERVYHDTNRPSNSGYRDNSQVGRHHMKTDLQGFEPAPSRRTDVHSNTSRSGQVNSKESARKGETSVAPQNPVLNKSFEMKVSCERGRGNQSENSDMDFLYEKDTLHKEDGFLERSHLGNKGSVQEGGAEYKSVINNPQMSALEVRVKQTGVEVPCIFVTNFQKWTTEKHLSRWFANYNPISVCLLQCASTGMRKAHIELSDVEMVRQAVYEMNQKKISEMKIKVDVPYFLPKLRAEVLGTNPVSLKRMKNPKLSPFIGDQGMLEELAQHRKTVTEQLSDLDLSLSSGSEVEVMVTNVISDNHFMGQPQWGDVVQRLREISTQISAAGENLFYPCQEERLQFQGACLAKWKMDYQWHRGWLLGGHAHDKAAQVYLLDVGVLDFVAWSCVREYDDPSVWDLPPVALPFSLSEPIVQLKNRLRSQITVTVTDTDKDGIITARPLSLISNWKEMLNIDTVLY